MSSANANRNMLVGIVALQMDFIDRDQLVAAMQAWLGAKSKSLDAILAEQGAISADTQEILAGLIDKHVEMHAGDPAQSLAAVDLSEPLRRELSQIQDADVNKTLDFISATKQDASPNDAFATTAFEVAGRQSSDSRFRVLRIHDRGGLGTVAVALDEELNRHVALKEIHERFADNDLARERFTLEAEITGGLEHPGIVPVYGFGHYSDGRPFYAMKFIRGDNLKYAISRYHDPDRAADDGGDRAIQFRRLLAHLVDVCHAIHYAHCRGVLHRDLKPANIMLGKYGETLVVDWGLAKTSLHPESDPLTNEPPLHPVFSSGTDHTRQGTQIGTPAYMSPEQAQGRLDFVDARSDVYSLGATLYELLTGKVAFQQDSVETILKKVVRGEFPHPRKIHPSAPPPLAAICLKAMAFNPADRYVTATALADDVEHWLADEPVSAWKEPLAVRTRRWIKRHRTIVVGASAACAAALVILSVAVGLLNAAKNREANERQRAEQNLSLAKNAVDVMLTEVASVELENVPQMETTRGKLLAKARDFYEQFRNQTPDDPELKLETAIANKRLGDIFRFMGEVVPSEQAYQSAIEQLDSLRDEHPDQPEYQRQLANASNYLGVLYKKFDRDKALSTYDGTVELQSDLVERYPTNASYRQELARSHYNRGILYTANATTAPQAEADFAKAIEQLQSVIDGSLNDADIGGCRQELARCYSNLAILFRSQGQFKPARENYERAVGLAEALAAEFPQQREYKKELALYYNNLSNLLVAQTDEPSIEAAQSTNRQSLALYEDLAAAVPEVRSDLGNIHHSRGVILAKQGRSDEAQREFQFARAIFVPLAAEFEDFPIYADRLGNSLYELAKLRYAIAQQSTAAGDASALEEYREALDLARQAVRSHRRIVQRYQQDPASQAHLRNDHYLIAWTLKQLSGLSDVSLDDVATVESADALAELSPDNPEHLKLAAELFAIGARLVNQDPDADEAQRQALQQKRVGQSVELLRRATELGLRDPSGLKAELQSANQSDSIFHPLYGNSDFAELINALEE